MHVMPDHATYFFSALIAHLVNFRRDTIPEGVEYLLYMDAYDSMLVNDAGNLVADFLSYDAEMLIIATMANWPVKSPWRTLFK